MAENQCVCACVLLAAEIFYYLVFNYLGCLSSSSQKGTLVIVGCLSNKISRENTKKISDALVVDCFAIALVVLGACLFLLTKMVCDIGSKYLSATSSIFQLLL